MSKVSKDIKKKSSVDVVQKRLKNIRIILSRSKYKNKEKDEMILKILNFCNESRLKQIINSTYDNAHGDSIFQELIIQNCQESVSYLLSKNNKKNKIINFEALDKNGNNITHFVFAAGCKSEGGLKFAIKILKACPKKLLTWRNSSYVPHLEDQSITELPCHIPAEENNLALFKLAMKATPENYLTKEELDILLFESTYQAILGQDINSKKLQNLKEQRAKISKILLNKGASFDGAFLKDLKGKNASLVESKIKLMLKEISQFCDKNSKVKKDIIFNKVDIKSSKPLILDAENVINNTLDKENILDNNIADNKTDEMSVNKVQDEIYDEIANESSKSLFSKVAAIFKKKQ